MKEYDVKITPDALAQMEETVRYIAGKLRAPDTAQNWLATMKKEFAALSSMPARIPLTPEEPWRSQGVHRLLVGNFYGYFWIDEEHRQVWILAVIYARADQASQLTRLGI